MTLGACGGHLQIRLNTGRQSCVECLRPSTSHGSLVPRPRPAFCRLQFFRATEKWRTGLHGNEAIVMERSNLDDWMMN